MRLFVAVEVPARVRDAVADAVAPLREREPGLRWVDPSRYHLTVVFLGSVDEALVPGVTDAVAGAADGVDAFALSLDGRLGTFGRRVLWAGLDPSPAMTALGRRVSRALGGVVALPDAGRELRPHLTLARAGRRPVPRRVADGVVVPALTWHVGRVALLRSAGGYEVVEAFGLRGGDA